MIFRDDNDGVSIEEGSVGGSYPRCVLWTMVVEDRQRGFVVSMPGGSGWSREEIEELVGPLQERMQRLSRGPPRTGRALGQAVNKLTAIELDDLFPHRYSYSTVGPDFTIVDSAMREVTYVELTTTKQVNAHRAKGGDYDAPFTDYATYSLP